MNDSTENTSDYKIGNNRIRINEVILPDDVIKISVSDITDNTDGLVLRKNRSRAVSLSLDWDNVVTSLEKSQKIRKRSRGDDLEEKEGFVRHPGWVQIERSTHSFITGSSYTGQWNGVGMNGSGNFVFPHAFNNISRQLLIMSSFKLKPATKNSVMSHDWGSVIATDFSVISQTGPRLKGQSFAAYDLPHKRYTIVYRSCERFCTGSSYTGEWSPYGMESNGLFSYMTDVDYEGTLRDGMFHGEGTLTYPMGQKIDGHWVKGKLVSFKFRFADDLEYDDPWKYCQMPDRRFYTSVLDGLRPAGRSLLTNIDPTREIPEGCYDTGDGFYNPETKCVWSAIKPNKILRVPTAAEEKWIMENCRKAWDEPTGHKPELFEHWVSGRQSDSVFQPSDDSSENKTDTESELSLNINMIIPPTYNVSPGSSRTWWDSLVGDIPNQVSLNV